MNPKLFFIVLLLLAFSNLYSQNCVQSWLENIAGDSYAIKFRNNCDNDLRVYYTVQDGNKVIQEESSVFVRKGSENVSGIIHCSGNANIEISKTTDINNSQVVSYKSKELNSTVSVDLNNLSNNNARVFALIANDAKKSATQQEWKNWIHQTNKTAMNFLDKARRDFVKQKKQQRAQAMAQRAALNGNGNYNSQQHQFNSKAYDQLRQINSTGWGGQ